MKNKKYVLKSLISVLILLWLISFISPELTIRRYILLHFQPIKAFTVSIEYTQKYDPNNGYLYDVNGYIDAQTDDAIDTFYLKKYGFIWLVSSAGTAP